MKKAFTLIEIIFVIVLIGIVAAIAVPKFTDTRDEATSRSIKQDISTITKSIQTYYMTQQSISDLADAVEFNSNRWIKDASNLKLTYSVLNAACVEIEFIDTTKTLSVDISETSSTLCQKIADGGVEDFSEILY